MVIDSEITQASQFFDLSSSEWDAVRSMHDLDTVNMSSLKSFLSDTNISNNYLAEISPFVITVNINTQIIITRLLRVLPNRRLVFVGVLKTSDLESNIVLKKIIFKIFIDDNKYKKDYDSIIKAYSTLQYAGLTTPKIISSNCNEQDKLSCFVYKYISQDSSLSLNVRYKIIIEAIAKLHNNNYIQQDLHFDNFIISDDKLYFIDIQSIDFDCNSINQRKLENFSLFLAQLPINEHRKWNEYTNYYFSCLLNKDIINDIDDKQLVLKLARIKYQDRVKNFINKCQRDSTFFQTVSNKKVFSVSRRNHDKVTEDFVNEFMCCQSTVLKKYGIKLIKDGNTAKVWLLSYNSKSYLVKHYLSGKSYVSKVLRNFKSLFSGHRAMNSWSFANVLEHVGIGVSKPVAVLLNKQHNMVNDSYFVMEYDDSFVRADQILQADISSKFYIEDKQTYINQIKDLLEVFSKLHIVHNDFKDVNLGFVNNKLLVLDLDAMHIYKNKLFFKLKSNKDIKRLLKCYDKHPEIVELFNN